MESDYKEKIMQMLERATEPLDIEKIRVGAGIGHWNTALKHCLELVIAKKIQGLKTSKSWVFWKNKRDGEVE